MGTITSRQHAVVKTFRTIARGDDHRAVIDGWHLLHEAARAALAIETIALADEPRDERDRRLIDALAERATVVQVGDAVMNALSPVRTPSGVAAIVRRRTWSLPDVLRPSPPLVVVAMDLQDPGNAGAIVRAADAGGATGVVLAGSSADPWSWKALRAGMGSTFRLPVVRERDAIAVCDALARAGLRLLATTPHGGATMYDIDLSTPTAVVIGSEGPGLPDALVQRADGRLTIPMAPGVDSLNAAVASALIVYEARRQRT